MIRHLSQIFQRQYCNNGNFSYSSFLFTFYCTYDYIPSSNSQPWLIVWELLIYVLFNLASVGKYLREKKVIFLK